MTPVTAFRCDRLHVRLSVAACTANYRKVSRRRRGGVLANVLTTRASAEKSRGCPVGEAHAKGEPTPAELLVTITPKGTGPAEPEQRQPGAASYHWYGKD